MKKDTFLAVIRQDAHGGSGLKVWEHAVKIDEKDSRWSLIYAESMGTDELIQQYAKYFGLEIQAPAKKERMTQVARWTKKIEEAKAMMDGIAPKHMEELAANLEELEQKLQHAIEHNL